MLSLHYNGSNSFLSSVTIGRMKKTGLKGGIKVFSVNYNAIDTNNILDIHIYLMKET